MHKLTAHDAETQSLDLVADNIAKLTTLFPEILTEGADGSKRVDFDALRELLGQAVEEKEERYNFTWHGKAQARRLAQTPSLGTLRPCPAESKHWDSTQNLFIEGDNLEVLKLLQKSYHQRVKMIYIDPPYNTGKDFIYPDNYRDNIGNYLELTGQVEGGRKMGTNTETSGRYHTNWLNMMYPRLKLARNLLREDGVIFISIDDTEVANLRKLCDEIFGEENFIAVFPWRSRTAKADVPFGVSVDVEWVVAYGKPNFMAGRSGERKYFKSDDYDDRWRLQDLTTNKTKEERPNSYFSMVNPKNGDAYSASATRTWAVTTDTFPDYYAAGKIVFPGDYDFLNIKGPAFRVFEREDKEKALKKYGTEDVKMSVSTYLPEKDVGRTEHGSKEIRDIFGSQVFSYPKPMGLIKFFVENCSDADSIVVDFFAGSGTTANAIIQQNALDGGQRKFLLVQLPEYLDPENKDQKIAADYCDALGKPRNIAELTKERIRRAGEKVLADNAGKDGIDKLDVGFKVFKLDSTNIKPWDVDFDQLESKLPLFADSLKDDRSAEDVLYEILLKYGLDLSLPITTYTLSGKTVYSIGMGALIVCLDKAITLDTVEGIAKLKDELQPEDSMMRVVFRDSGFADDVVKVNAVQILKQAGIEDVRSV